MIKLQRFFRHEEYERQGRVIYSAEYEFSKWDQADVKSIISIQSGFDQDGMCQQILVFYEAIEEDAKDEA